MESDVGRHVINRVEKLRRIHFANKSASVGYGAIVGCSCLFGDMWERGASFGRHP